MMDDSLRSRFDDEVRLRGLDDAYIDKNEEREILQIAIHQGAGLEAGRAALAEACDRHGFVLESALVRRVKEWYAETTVGDRLVQRADFDRLLATLRDAARGKRGDRDLRRLAVTVMEDHGMTRVKSAWPRNWYAAAKRDARL